MSGICPEWVQNKFDVFERSLNGAKQSQIHELRRHALGLLTKNGFPTAQSEDWRYTNPEPTLSLSRVIATGGATTLDAARLDSLTFCPDAKYRLVIVNGAIVPSLSSMQSVTVGLEISTIEEVSHRSDNARAGVGEVATLEGNPFAALNTALMQSGVVIRVAKGAQIDTPIEIISYCDESAGAVLATPRILIEAAELSSLTVVEVHAGTGQHRYLACPLTEIQVGDAASVDHYKLGLEGEQADHIGSVHVNVGRSSNFRTHLLSLGGQVVRNEVYLNLIGEGSNSTLNGITALGGSQHLDNYTVIRNAQPHCESIELFKGIYSDQSRGVFQGTIIVEKDAQKTNAIQSNQSLLLSDSASVDTKPQLKIWADDVKCTHGATIGQLDEDALFYCRSRGINRSVAQAMLTEAFAAEVFEAIKVQSVREKFLTLFRQKLHLSAQE